MGGILSVTRRRVTWKFYGELNECHCHQLNFSFPSGPELWDLIDAMTKKRVIYDRGRQGGARVDARNL